MNRWLLVLGVGFCVIFTAKMALAQQPAPLDMPLYNGRIMPTPQSVKYYERFIPIQAAHEGRAITAIFIRQGLERDIVVEELMERLKGLGAEADVITDRRELPRYRTVISLGDNDITREYLARSGIEIPHQPEGYLIHPVRESERDLVICAGNDEAGNYWAVQSLCQLLNCEKGSVKLLAAEVADYPSFRYRGIIGVGRNVRYLHYFKFNVGMCRGLKDWRNPQPEEIKNIKDTVSYLKRRHLKPLLGFNPAKKPKINICDEADIKKLIEAFKISLDAGGGMCLLLDDVSIPLADADKKAFGDAGKAHRYLVDRLYNGLRADYPEFTFFFCPPYYASDLSGYYYGESGGRYYETMCNVPQDIEFFWSGPTVTSQGCSLEDAERWIKAIGRKPVYWDNWHQYGYPYAPKDFANRFPGFRRLDAYMMAYNYNNNSLIGILTLGDYLWNPNQYTPERSLENALEKLAGPGVYSSYAKWLESLDKVKKLRTTEIAASRKWRRPQLADVNGDGQVELVLSISQNVMSLYRRHPLTERWMADAVPADTAQAGGGDIAFSFGPLSVKSDIVAMLGSKQGGVRLFSTEDKANVIAALRRGRTTNIAGGAADVIPCLGDADGDGVIDLLLLTRGKDVKGYTVTENPVSFQEEQSLVSGLKGIADARCLAMTDLDGNGKAELVIVSSQGLLQVYRMETAKGGWFRDEALETSFSGIEAYAVCFGDINGDGKPDMVASNYYGSLTGYRNTGSVKLPIWQKDGALIPLDVQKLSGIDKAFTDMERSYKDMEKIWKYNLPAFRSISRETLAQSKWMEDLKR